jgi:hypothetical protein
VNGARLETPTKEKPMLVSARIVLGAAAFGALMFAASYGAQALPLGAKSAPRSEATIFVRRECIAWRRRPDGTTVCTNWGECTNSVC